MIQHDVDTQPERTHNLLRYEAARGIPSNVMIFNRRVNRRKLAATGELEFTPYPIDFKLLRVLQAQGFVIGYHANAYEQAQYDEARAREIFLQDVDSLRRQIDIRFFSAHGGTPGPGELNNRDLRLPADMLRDLVWVHNGATPYFSLSYSDGGINSPRRDPAKRDLRDFVRQWRPGNRYRVLTHPQYYHDPCRRSPRLSGAAWYEEVRTACSAGRGNQVWRGVVPGGPVKNFDWHLLIRRKLPGIVGRARKILNFRRRL